MASYISQEEEEVEEEGGDDDDDDIMFFSFSCSEGWTMIDGGRC
jgi:hypothetical protein